MLRKIFAVVPCALVLAACGGPAGDTATPNGQVTASPAQRSIQARWWEWASAEAEKTNPVADTTGEQCARNQPQDVWFLAGTFGGEVRRRCTVPPGVPLVAPAINLVGGDENDCRDYLAGGTGSVQVDGAEVSLERIESETVTFTAGQDNPLTDTAGEVRSEACGLWARIDPLSAGVHTVRIHGASGSFKVGAEYTLTVAGPTPSAG